MNVPTPAPRRARDLAYWTITLLFIGFGLIAIFSVGAPFLLVGVTLLALRPYRSNPIAFWPPLVGVIALILGYVLVAPLGCTAEARSVSEAAGEPSRTTCTNILGIHYGGFGSYNPPLWPAVLGGVGLGLVAAFVTRVTLVRTSHR